ncbi:hypothetical protein KVR01_002926 [Diaporthe batatas]|uniref:uncharacterized protein n=1 Tax=Diaporthe batatas TaxID=748121 RepID=UPI001D0530FF|nr:uncharacterized protein KVR01_002926 [Diaporthe batatas]KAG8167237.1 hypothetical protein KVR01_002926 [Diaporthe batatas]
MASIRTSIVLLYIHLFSTDNRFCIACYTILAINGLWFIADMCVVWLICLPAKSYWESSIQPHCGNISAAYLAIHVSNLFVDVLVAALPAQVLWHLQMPVTRKLGIMAMFALVALICSIAIARIATWKIALGLTSDDFTYTGTTLYLFSAIDVSVLCALACMPLLKPVGEKLASSSAVAWTRTLFQSLQSRAMKVSKGNQDWAKSRSGGEPYRGPPEADGISRSSGSLTSRELGLSTNHRVEQDTYLSNDSLEMEP